MNTRDDVWRFMEAAGQTQILNDDQADLYMNLVREEYLELEAAYRKRDLVGVADALADLRWVIEGLEHTLALPQQAIWDEVARSNLSKISSNGQVLKREDGKVLKPETYSPPDLETVLKNSQALRTAASWS